MRYTTRTVGILGGMGPAAGADFARLFVQACAEELRRRHLPVTDQAFPEHWLAQVPVPDRSSALAGPHAQQPLAAMRQAVGQLAGLGARTVALACNTAHAWHADLQAEFPQVELLHVAQEVAASLARRGVKEVGLLATQGTYHVGLYDQACRQAGLVCHVPDEAGRERLMQGIYQGVKAGEMELARQCFGEVAQALARAHGLFTLVLGCTELPLALSAVPGMAQVELLDPAVVLAQALARRAYGADGSAR